MSRAKCSRRTSGLGWVVMTTMSKRRARYALFTAAELFALVGAEDAATRVRHRIAALDE
jgi:hypothetical protein